MTLRSKSDKGKRSCGVQADNNVDGKASRARDSAELQRELDKIEAQEIKKVSDRLV